MKKQAKPMTKNQANQKVTDEPVVNNQIDEKDAEIAALKDRLARALADYRNLETRSARDNSVLIKFANSSILEKLLEVRDHLGMAAASGDKSLSIILTTFDKILTSEGVTTIRTEGAFDPTLMEAADQVDGKENEIVETLRLGYMLGDRVLRVARVTVGNGKVN